MAEVSGLDMIREIIGQINNLRRLVTINGKKFKWDGKKYVRAVDGKTFTKKELTSFVKNQKFTAPEVPKKEKPKTKLKVKTTPKAKQNPLKVGKEKLNTFTQNRMNERWLNKRQNERNPKVDKQGLTKIGRANMNTGRLQSGGGIVNQVLGAVIGETEADLRLGNWIGNRIFSGPDYTYDEVKAMNAERLANRELKVQRNKQLNANKRERQNTILEMRDQPGTQQTGGAIGRSRQDSYLNRPTPTPTPNKDKPANKVKVSKKKENKSDNYWQSPKNYQAKTEKKETKGDKKKALKINKQVERRKKAIKRAYGNISDKRLNQLLSRAVTQRELEES